MALQYVILHHTGFGPPHYDLMFETSAGIGLATWRSNTWPVNSSSRLTPLAEHRRAYLQYEGPVSGGRGSVRRVHSGTYSILEDAAAYLIVGLEDGTALKLSKQ